MSFNILINFIILISVPLKSFSQTDNKSPAKPKVGYLKEKLTKRWIKKQEKKPAPKTNAKSTDLIKKPGSYTIKIQSSNLDRYYQLYIPPQYKPDIASPLVVALHGGGGNMKIQANNKYYKLISKSKKEGFILAFPNGYSNFKSGILATWNAGECCASARDKNIDDVKFIIEMVDTIKKQVNIVADKVFAIGMSNGAMMSYRLACDSKGIFQAIAAVAGTDVTKACKPQSPISVLHIHAQDDDHVLFNGGAGINSFHDNSKVTEFTSVPKTVEKWIKINECNLKPKKILSTDKAYCELYSGCKNNSRVQLCVTKDGGHSWPGGSSPRNNKKKSSSALSANEVIWDFFKNK